MTFLVQSVMVASKFVLAGYLICCICMFFSNSMEKIFS